MATALEVLKRLQLPFAGEDKVRLELLPPLSEDEFRRLEAQVPCPIPEEARDLFRYARGFKLLHPLLHGAHRRLSSVDLTGLDTEFGLEQVFPHAYSIADDGCGNFWVLDLTHDAKLWGPIFYACHDPGVVVYQAPSVAHFIEEVLRGSEPPGRSEIHEVHEELTTRIWLENPGVVTFEQRADSHDEDLKIFAQSLDASYEFIDLRAPKLGDGFTWARYGPWTVNKRFGEKRLFAYKKKTKWERFKQLWK